MAIGSKKKTTLQDLAQLAGVSISTISRALNDHPLISSRTKQRIWALAHAHDYPFRASMPIAPIGSEGSIVIVTPQTRGRPLPLSHPFFLELLACIGEAARSHDCDFTVSHLSPVSYDDLFVASTTSRANGTIFLGQGYLHESFNRLADQGIAFVVWGAELPEQRYRSIGSDNFSGGKRATDHLIRLGRRRIAFLGGTDPEAQQRCRGYIGALEHADIDFDNKRVATVEFELDQADAAVSHMIESGVSFDAIVASSDLIALGAIQALQRSGQTIPDDVAVVGYDDMLLSRLSTPKLTTIRQDTGQAGRLLVSSVLNSQSEHKSVRLPTELIIRGSCGA